MIPSHPITLANKAPPLEPVWCKKHQKKSPDQLVVCRIGDFWKDLNDSKLIEYESKWFPWSSMINCIPFRIFRSPLFHKPVTGRDFFYFFTTLHFYNLSNHKRIKKFVEMLGLMFSVQIWIQTAWENSIEDKLKGRITELSWPQKGEANDMNQTLWYENNLACISCCSKNDRIFHTIW